MDIFLLNSILETSAGVLTIIEPSILLPKLNEIGKFASRSWSLAILILGITSFYAWKAPDHEHSKRGFAYAMIAYHLGFSALVMRSMMLREPSVDPSLWIQISATKYSNEVAILTHCTVALGFIWWVKSIKNMKRD